MWGESLALRIYSCKISAELIAEVKANCVNKVRLEVIICAYISADKTFIQNPLGIFLSTNLNLNLTCAWKSLSAFQLLCALWIAVSNKPWEQELDTADCVISIWGT